MERLMLREAKPEDLTEIVQMLADDELGANRESFSLPVAEYYQKAYDAIRNDPHQQLMVAQVGADIVGTLQLSFIQYLTYKGGVRAQIEGVRIHQAHRNKGYGRQMIMEAITLSREKGAHLIQLTTDKKRPEAIRFYHELGFKASHEGMKLHF